MEGKKEEKSRPARIALPRKQHRIVTRVLDRWRDEEVIDEGTRARLADSISIQPFDWQKTARYAFIVAVVCFVIAVGALVADHVFYELFGWLYGVFEALFESTDAAKCAFLSVVAALLFWFGLHFRKKHPQRIYSNEAVFFVGVLAVAWAIAHLGLALATGSGHYSLLFLLAAGLYAALGLWLPSALVWVFALLSLGAWLGAETGYVSGRGMYWLGMNYPLRFVLFGGLLALAGVAMQR
ncbi:MAG: DUF2157 domain-containing protein, partial [Candidatus Accumulibacter sp.]|nr:DUF2157 domain-containing protein [Accumulibacter sp.]